MNNKIVYRHRRVDNNIVFYIGAGTKKRPYDKTGRSVLWIEIKNQTDYVVEILQTGLSKEEADELEEFLIYLYGRKDLGKGNLVNMTDGGNNLKNAKTWLGKCFTEKHKNNISNGCKGRVHSKEHKDKISKSGKGRLNSEEVKKKMSESHHHEKKVVCQIDVEGNIIEEFNSLKECSEKLKIPKPMVSRVCNGKAVTTKGLMFKYKN
jgi:hypothetical protein